MMCLRNLLFCMFLAAMSLQAQNAGTAASPDQTAMSFRLDPSLPFAYLKFDHIGAGAKLRNWEPSVRIWLHLVNNCRLPIVVRGSDGIDGGLEGEVFLNNEVRLNPPVYGMAAYSTKIEPDQPPIATSLVISGQRPSQKTPAKSSPTISKAQPEMSGDDEASMPLGYPPVDIVSTETIMPGADVLFSVPVNFVTKKWHFEIPLSFASERSDEGIPEQLFLANSEVRGEVHIILSYGFWDLPKEHQTEVENLNQKLQKKP